MNEWMDGWMDGWIGVWLAGWMDGQMVGWTERRMDAGKFVQTNYQRECWRLGWTGRGYSCSGVKEGDREEREQK